jgi:CPA2 family monovalent cation:H+ antiporter-2
MTAALGFIKDLTVVLLSAFIVGVLFHRIRQPAILGYLLAGALIGPYALQIISSVDTINLLAELGVILLMFSIGLEFNLKRLRKVGSVAVVSGVAGIVAMIFLGKYLGGALGWSRMDSLFLGGILSLSSTSIVGAVLMERGFLQRQYAQIILGILVVEDLAGVVLLTVFSSISMLTAFSLEGLLPVLFRVFLFFVTTLVFGLKIVPRGMDWVSRSNPSGEVLTLGALAMAFLLSVFSASLGFSVALGAFLMGAILSEAAASAEIERTTRPIKDVFATLFFFSIGMLFDVGIIQQALPLLLFLASFAVLFKALSRFVATYLCRYSGAVAFSVGIGLIQVGEFSFVIARQGVDLGLIHPLIFQYTVAISLLTAFLTPFTLRRGPEIALRLDPLLPLGFKRLARGIVAFWAFLRKQLPFDVEAEKIFRRKVNDIGVNLLILLFVWLAFLGVRDRLTFSSLLLPSVGMPASRISPLPLALPLLFSLPSLSLILMRVKELIGLSMQIMEKRFEVLGKNLRLKLTLQILLSLGVLLVSTLLLLPLLLRAATGYTPLSLLLLLGAVLLSGYFFWHAILRFQKGLDRMIRDALLAEEPVGGGGRKQVLEEAVDRIRRSKIMGQIMVTDESPLLGKTIAEINFRARTGATILSIERGGEILSHPKPDETLRLWDILILLGTDEERKEAQRLLYGGEA